jgi:hypothetical protein
MVKIKEEFKWESLSIKQDTKEKFEKARFIFKLKAKKLVSQDDFINYLLNLHKLEKNNLN